MEVEVEGFFCCVYWVLDADIGVLPRRRRKIPEPDAATEVFGQFFSRQSSRSRGVKVLLFGSLITHLFAGFCFVFFVFFSLI